MPFKSKAQQRFMFAAEAKGDLPQGTARRWAHETDMKNLPERKKEARITARGLNKLVYLLDKLEDTDTNVAKNILDLHNQEKKAAVELLKHALAIPGPGQVRQITTNTVGKFRGIAGQTPAALRAPGPKSPNVLDPTRSIPNAMKAFR